ncbi:aminotransferase class V-fold PLP-dependent enzyme, partial [Intestinibacillus massiliensis]|nr:aminotransferase class V-fold PLP-dependent enzyme [Intestinibacillus massiliensis]
MTTSMEHNAVVRPLTQLEKEGVLWSEAQCDAQGRLNVEEIRKLIRPETKLVLAIHGSNVCGTLIPIKEIGSICKETEIFFCVDASQTAGSAFIDMEECCADALIAPGHKALLGPQGIGIVLLSK